MVEDCFEAMLNHWVGRSSPPPSWSAVIRALESPAIARGDIATKIKVGHKPAVQACSTPSIILIFYFIYRKKEKLPVLLIFAASLLKVNLRHIQ